MWMKVVRMMRVLRHGLFSLAFAVLFVAVALLSGHGGVTGESRPTLAVDAAAAQPDPDRVNVRTTVAPTVVCDEGVPPDLACRVSVVLGAAMPAEATTYDRSAVAGEDYLPLLVVPVKVIEREGSAEISVDLVDDKECEPKEDFLVVVTGPEVQVITEVSILDDDC
jgi:hypothetical protein